MSRKQPPTIRLRRLASELLRLRQEADLTREEVTERTQINTATIFRLETARVRPQVRTLTTLLDLYGVEDQKKDELVTLLRESSQRGWLQTFPADLPEKYSSYISFESEAASLLNYETSFVPGLLQTEEYARAVIKGTLPAADRDDIENRVQARMKRQDLLRGTSPLKLWAIADEAVFHRKVGSPAIMRAQIAHARELAELPHVTLQVIPYDAGAHPGMLGSFVIMGFDGSNAPDVVYIESGAGDLFLEDEASTKRYNLTFEHLRAAALSPVSSDEVLAGIAGQC